MAEHMSKMVDMHVEMMCEDGKLNVRWPKNENENEKVYLSINIDEAEQLIDLARKSIAEWRKEQN